MSFKEYKTLDLIKVSRSVIACSILMKNGKKDLINVLEGYSGVNKQIESQ